jgi:hypothetical protein
MRALLLLFALFASPLAAQSISISSGTAYPPEPPALVAPGVNGALIFKQNADGFRIGPVSVAQAYRAVETVLGTTISNGAIAGLTAQDLQRDGIRLRNAVNVTISDFDLKMRAAPQTGTHLPEGIAISAGQNITIRNGKVGGFRMASVAGKYTNGDGIATEGDVDGLLIENVTAYNNSDAGFDIKGRNVILRDLTAIDNNRAFRIWSPSAQATTLTAENFTGAGLWVGNNGSIIVDRFVARSRTPSAVFRWESGATIVVGSCDLTGMAPGSRLTQPDGRAVRIELGPGCKL